MSQMPETLGSTESGQLAGVAPLPLLSRITGAILSPTAVFQNLRHHPRFLGVLLVTVLVSLGSYLFMAPIINEAQLTQMTEAVERNDNISEEQKGELIEQQRELMAKPIMRALGPLSVLLIIPLFYALGALLLQLGCNFILGATISFKQALAGTLHASLPATIFGALLKTPLIVATKNMHAATSLALLLPEPDPTSALFGLLNSLDVFTIWTAILIVLAGAGLTGFKTARTRVLGIIFMIVAALSGVVGALLQGLSG